MKITMFAPAPENRGVFWRAFFLGKYLKKFGHDVEIICNNSKPTWKLAAKKREGVKLILLPTTFNILKWMIMQPYLTVLASFKILRNDSDVFHFFGNISPVTGFLSLIKRIQSKKKIIVDWDDWWWGENDGILQDYNIFLKSFGKFFEEFSPKLGSTVTVVSERIGNRAEKIGAKKIVKIENGSNVDAIKPMSKNNARKKLKLPLKAKIICHLGFTDMVGAFEVVKKEYPKAKLLIVGHKPAYAHKRIKSMKDNQDIIYTGQKPLNKISTYLAAADVTCINMDKEISEEARWPIRFGDYIAAGRPVVVGDIGEIGKIVNKEKIGLTYKPGDKKDFGKKLIKAMETKFDEKKIRKLAVEKYSWEKMALKLEKLYKNL